MVVETSHSSEQIGQRPHRSARVPATTLAQSPGCSHCRKAGLGGAPHLPAANSRHGGFWGADSRYRASSWPPPKKHKPHVATGSPVPLGPLWGGWLHVGAPKGTLKLPHPTPSYRFQPPAVHPSPHTNGLWRPPASPKTENTTKNSHSTADEGELGFAGDISSTGGYQRHPLNDPGNEGRQSPHQDPLMRQVACGHSLAWELQAKALRPAAVVPEAATRPTCVAASV